jgi:hypothetical protein
VSDLAGVYPAVVYRPPARRGGSASRADTFCGLEAPTVCRWCRRSTVGARGVVEHYDGARGEAWAEHQECARTRKPTRDWLAPTPGRLLP